MIDEGELDEDLRLKQIVESNVKFQLFVQFTKGYVVKINMK